MPEALHTSPLRHGRVENHDKELIPRRLLIATVALVLSTLALVTVAKVFDAPIAATPDMAAPVDRERLIILDGKMNGSATVLDVNGAVIAQFPPDKGGFIAGVKRALDQVRGQAGVGASLPVRLIRFENGRLALVDDHTGWRAELIGFGADNHAAFARLLN